MEVSRGWERSNRTVIDRSCGMLTMLPLHVGTIIPHDIHLRVQRMDFAIAFADRRQTLIDLTCGMLDRCVGHRSLIVQLSASCCPRRSRSCIDVLPFLP
jgi:hypothetical protein